MAGYYPPPPVPVRPPEPSTPMKKKQHQPVLLILALLIAIGTATIFLVKYHLYERERAEAEQSEQEERAAKEAAVQSELDEMEMEVTHAQALYADVSALFSQQYPDFPADGLTLAYIDEVKSTLKDIRREPDREYAVEVKREMDLAGHAALIDEMLDMIYDVRGKVTALEEVRVLFEVEPIIDGISVFDLPLAMGVDEKTVANLTTAYKGMADGDCDSFWDELNYILEDAAYQLMYIKDAREAVQYIKMLAGNAEQSDIDFAQGEINYIYEGSQRAAMQARLDAVKNTR